MKHTKVRMTTLTFWRMRWSEDLAGSLQSLINRLCE